MKLLVMRHCMAGGRISDDQQDDARILAPEGVKAAQAMGDTLDGLYLNPKCVYSSSIVRATMTGKIIAEATGADFKVDKNLNPGSKTLADWIYGLVDAKKKWSLIVTHSDLLQDVIAKLFNNGGDPADVEPFVMGEVRVFDANTNTNHWPLLYRITPNTLIGGFQNRI